MPATTIRCGNLNVVVVVLLFVAGVDQMVYYNFGRLHQTLRVSSAIDAGVSNHILSIEKIVGFSEER